MVHFSSLRVGIVKYVNALPLEYDLDRFLPGAKIVLDVPSSLGRQMERGELDVALLSSIALYRHSDYGFIPGLGISSDGPVRSVCLFCKKPLSEIQTVALDQSSLTSVTMIRILFADFWKCQPRYFSFQPPIENGLNIADAALAIGDPTLLFDGKNVEAHDAGELWRQYSRLPFVYAVWVTRPGLDPQSLIEPFSLAAESGLSNIDAISEQCAQKTPLTADSYRDYFTRCIQYKMTDKHMEGMHYFFDKTRTIPGQSNAS
ncbi:MAG: menaquinone biosynthesis protein [Candidatus Omnitrophica bacterium]|nr:menaquinone biosynthesis protein [Candidatus Omnitrophota bacterium]